MEANLLLRSIADNPSLMEEVRKLLLNQFSLDSLTKDQSDEVLGQMVRARLLGLEKVEAALKEISQHKTPEKTGDNANPAY